VAQFWVGGQGARPPATTADLIDPGRLAGGMIDLVGTARAAPSNRDPRKPAREVDQKFVQYVRLARR